MFCSNKVQVACEIVVEIGVVNHLGLEINPEMAVVT